LRQEPKLLLLFTAGKSGMTPSSSYLFAIGATDAIRSSMSVGIASHGGVTPANTSRRMARKALSLVQWGEVTVAEADVASWNASSFTLDWTTNGASASMMHFVAVGGSGVASKVASWRAPSSPGRT